MRWLSLLPMLALSLLLVGSGYAEESAPEAADTPESDMQDAPDTVALPDPMDLLKAADQLFVSQKIGRLSAKITVYRDPADLIPLKALREDRVNAPGLIPLQGRYEYWSPNGYNFYLLGMLLASSEHERGAQQGLTSPLLPLPGGTLASAFVQESFRLRVSGIEAYELGDGKTVDCYVVRLTPKDYEREFFKTLTYYMSVEQPHMIRGVRANFSDGGSWVGTGWGTFYYLKDRKGRTLPFIGEGQINFRNPDRRVVLKGKWGDFKTNEEASINVDAITTDAPEAPVDRESAVKKF